MTTVKTIPDFATVYYTSGQLLISQRRPSVRTEGHCTVII